MAQDDATLIAQNIQGAPFRKIFVALTKKSDYSRFFRKSFVSQFRRFRDFRTINFDREKFLSCPISKFFSQLHKVVVDCFIKLFQILGFGGQLLENFFFGFCEKCLVLLLYVMLFVFWFCFGTFYFSKRWQQISCKILSEEETSYTV